MAAPKPVPKPEVKDKKPEAPPAQPSAAVKPRRRKLIAIAAAATTLVLAAAGGTAWYLARPKGQAEAAPAPPKARIEKPKQAIFVPLETFTVNLQPESGDRYLQTTLSLKVNDPGVELALKQQMPEVRSRVLLLLSSKRASELTSVEGKQTLANQIAAQVNQILNPGAAVPAAKAPENAPPAEGKPGDPAPPPVAPAQQEPAPDGPVLSVLFTNFIIQ